MDTTGATHAAKAKGVEKMPISLSRRDGGFVTVQKRSNFWFGLLFWARTIWPIGVHVLWPDLGGEIRDARHRNALQG